MSNKPAWLAGALIAAAAALGVGSATAQTDSRSAAIQIAEADRTVISIVGSSTLAPFLNRYVDQFVKRYNLPRPMTVEYGSREGLRQFCMGLGIDFPDILASSVRLSKGAYDNCAARGVTDIIEIPIGYDAIVIVTEKGDPILKPHDPGDPPLSFEPRHLYLAMAAEVPRQTVIRSNVPREVVEQAEKLRGEDFMANPFKTWDEIDPKFPKVPIRVRGPNQLSGTRQFINDVMLEAGCRNFPAIKDIFAAVDRVAQCTRLRGAPYFQDVAEPFAERVIKEVMDDLDGTLGFVSYDVYDDHRAEVDMIAVSGVIASPEVLKTDKYSMRRRLYIYAKRAHLRGDRGQPLLPGLREIVTDLTNDDVLAAGGLVTQSDFIPLSDSDRARIRSEVTGLRILRR